MSTKVQFVQLNSSVNPSFWNKFSELKLDVLKLEDKELNIWGYLSIIGSRVYPTEPITLLEVDSTSFNGEFNAQNLYLPFHGKIFNKNTLDAFKKCDKTELINQEGKALYSSIVSGQAVRDPSLLNRFFILSFADLKKYHFYYWFAFPVPRDLVLEIAETRPVTDEFTKEMLADLLAGYKELDASQKTYFMVYKKKDRAEVHTLSAGLNNNHFKKETSRGQFFFAFHNAAFDNTFVGSQLRNYAALVMNCCNFLQDQIVNFIALHITRDGPSITCKESVLYRLTLPSNTQETFATWVGWEKNERDKMGPRLAKMRDILDPQVIAENSVDLNLKLMKWNLLPDINLERIRKTKFLLLGSGTLGCNVARTLLAWGVRHITFVDNSTVSFSNPVRQSLYSYQDSLKMRPKALAAAENLKSIFPGVNSKGQQLSIPMPGHTVSDSMLKQTEENVDSLWRLIKENDVIFLLLDSRESRWLPTLLASLENKVVINAALGFDSFLVMRHGIFEPQLSTNELVSIKGFKAIRGNNLACYFCSDVSAPGNSLKERTLDQQCTVTRPGVSMIAGAMAVELAISILQHKDGIFAPAYYSTSASYANTDVATQERSILGMVPHSIRGFLSSYEQILPATEKYKHCVACSELIIEEFKRKGMSFLLEVFNSSKHLEDVALLSEMFNEIKFSEILEFDDGEDFPVES